MGDKVKCPSAVLLMLQFDDNEIGAGVSGECFVTKSAELERANYRLQRCL